MTKRDAICDAALALFAAKGIEATTTREIAERADAAEGTLYRHFGGKKDLAESLYARCIDRLREGLRKRVHEANTPRERLEGVIRGVFDFHHRQPDSCAYLLSACGSRPVDESEPRPAPLPLMVEILEDGIERGEFQRAPASLMAGGIVALVQQTVRFLESDAIPVDSQEAIDWTIAAALRLTAAETR